MQQNQESNLLSILHSLSQKAKALFEYCRRTSQSQISKAIQKSQPLLSKTKEFYHQHQKVILIVSTAAVVYLLSRGSKKSEDNRPRKKKQGATRIQVTGKVFVSDDSAEEYKQEPSTTIRVESSGKEVSKKRGHEKMSEQIQSSSEVEQAGDKIFFEMYQKYQNG